MPHETKRQLNLHYAKAIYSLRHPENKLLEVPSIIVALSHFLERRIGLHDLTEETSLTDAINSRLEENPEVSTSLKSLEHNYNRSSSSSSSSKRHLEYARRSLMNRLSSLGHYHD